MKRLTAFVAFITLSPVVWVETISPVSAQASCQGTVDAVEREIQKKGTRVKLRIYPDSNEYYNPLDNSRRIGSVNFLLNADSSSGRSDSVASNILNSKALMKSYASRVFASCGGTGKVGFGYYRTDWGVDFAMTDSGTLGYSKCSENPSEITNRISDLTGPGMGGYCAYIIPDF